MCELGGFPKVLFFMERCGRRERVNGIPFWDGMLLSRCQKACASQRPAKQAGRGDIFNLVTDGPLARAQKFGVS